MSSGNFLRELQAIRDERADIARRRDKAEGAVVVTQEQIQTVQGPPATLTDAPAEVVEFWRRIVGAVFERVVILPAGKGRRFSPKRVFLEPREGYEGAMWPVLAAAS
jgi:hypothetical protein